MKVKTILHNGKIINIHYKEKPSVDKIAKICTDYIKRLASNGISINYESEKTEYLEKEKSI